MNTVTYFKSHMYFSKYLHWLLVEMTWPLHSATILSTVGRKCCTSEGYSKATVDSGTNVAIYNDITVTISLVNHFIKRLQLNSTAHYAVFNAHSRPLPKNKLKFPVQLITWNCLRCFTKYSLKMGTSEELWCSGDEVTGQQQCDSPWSNGGVLLATLNNSLHQWYSCNIISPITIIQQHNIKASYC